MLIPLTVTPGSWRPYIESAAETFTAVVTDIPPGTDVSYEWSASDGSSEYDVSVSAEFSPNGSGEVVRAKDSLTVIRLELQAVYEAPANTNANRHTLGVGEKVRFLHYPG